MEQNAGASNCPIFTPVFNRLHNFDRPYPNKSVKLVLFTDSMYGK